MVQSARFSRIVFNSQQHASHVTISLVKQLSRIVPPKDGDNNQDHTFGITADPIAAFAIVLSALLHSIDHPGVSNSVLISERVPIAQVYNNQSVLEQNSFSLGYSLLMEDAFTDLRHCIYGNQDEFMRFKQWVVNSVLATDIEGTEVLERRTDRWNRAMEDKNKSDDVVNQNARKATVVVEHLLQVSNVTHAMQHWQIYCKWNERLFAQHFQAYVRGRTTQNPAEIWYQRELDSFDRVVIPLATRLSRCGVFGVSHVEYLNFAQRNRQEWETLGPGLVEGMVARASEGA